MSIQTIEKLMEGVIEECKNRIKGRLSPSEKMTPPECNIGQFVIIGEVVSVKIGEEFIDIGELKDGVFIERNWKERLKRSPNK